MPSLNNDAAPALPFPPSFNAAVKNLLIERLQELGDYDVRLCQFVVARAGTEPGLIRELLDFCPFETGGPAGLTRSVRDHHHFVEFNFRSPGDATAIVLIVQNEPEGMDPLLASLCHDVLENMA